MRFWIRLGQITAMLLGFAFMHIFIEHTQFRPSELAASIFSRIKLNLNMLTIFIWCDYYSLSKTTVLNRMLWKLPDELYGQPLALHSISNAINNNIEKFIDGEPISIHLTGPTGTGKSHACEIIADCLYTTGIKSPVVHRFEGRHLHLTEKNVTIFRNNLKDWIFGNLTVCSKSLFIFENTEHLPPQILEVIHPFLKEKIGGMYLLTTTDVNPLVIGRYRQLRDRGVNKSNYPIEKFQLFDETLTYTTDREYRLETTAQAIFLPMDFTDLQECMFNEFRRLGRHNPTDCTVQMVYDILNVDNQYGKLMSCKDVNEITQWVVMNAEC